MLTSEQAGIISALLLLHIMLLKYGTPECRCTINVWIDNEEAPRRITTSPADDIRLKAYGVRDYGDMVTMRQLLASIPSNIKLVFDKIKSHQDTTGNDLPFEAKLRKGKSYKLSTAGTNISLYTHTGRWNDCEN